MKTPLKTSALLSLTLPILCAASYAANIDLNGSTDPSTPILISSWAGTSTDAMLWRGKGLNSSTVTNCYVSVDADVTATQIFPSGGGGVHNNVCLVFENGKTLTLTSSSAFGFNDYYNENGRASYSLNYIFSTAEGNTATVNVNNATKYTLNLECLDNNFTGSTTYTTYGQTGRIFSIGKGISFNVAGDMEVKGHNAALTVSDSNFIVDGNMNAAKSLAFTNTIFTLNSTGVITSNSFAMSGTQATIDGSITSATGVTLGGTVNQSAGSVIKASTLGLSGGTVNLAGTVSQSDGSALTLSAVAGSTQFTKGANVNINAISLAGGAVELQDDLTVTQVSVAANGASGLSTAAGKTLTVTDASALGSTDNYSASVTFGGTINFTNSLASRVTDLTIAAGATVSVKNAEKTSLVFSQKAGTFLIKGTLLTQSGAYGFHTPSTQILAATTIDGGYFYDSSTGSSSSSIQFWDNSSLLIKNGGTIKVNSNNWLQFNNSNMTTDGTAKIDVGGIMFGNGSTNSVTIAKAEELVSKAKIFFTGPSNTANYTTADLILGSGAYSFGIVELLRSSKFNLHLNGSTASFDKFRQLNGGTGVSNCIFSIYDFVNEAVKMGNVTNEMISGDVVTLASGQTVTLVAYDSNDNQITGDWSIDGNGFLFNTGAIVPEPAEWAAIFGALALSLAMRRRKK